MAGPNVLKERKISRRFRQSNYETSAVEPVAMGAGDPEGVVGLFLRNIDTHLPLPFRR